MPCRCSCTLQSRYTYNTHSMSLHVRNIINNSMQQEDAEHYFAGFQCIHSLQFNTDMTRQEAKFSDDTCHAGFCMLGFIMHTIIYIMQIRYNIVIMHTVKIHYSHRQEYRLQLYSCTLNYSAIPWYSCDNLGQIKLLSIIINRTL